MKRQLCVTVFFALVLVPDWASACWPPPGGSYFAPVYSYPAPVYYYPPPPVYCQPVYVYPCAPVNGPALQPPKVESTRPNTAAEPPKGTAQPTPPAPARGPQVEAVRPAANVEAPKSADPKPTSAPRPNGGSGTPDPDKGRETSPPKFPKPDPTGTKIEFPPLTDPKVPATEPKLPPLVLPGEKADPKLPPLDLPKASGTKLLPPELPKPDAPKVPALELPKVEGPSKLPDVPGASAVPVPAPAPDALIPPPGVSVPRNPDALPPLTLPPDSPVAPDVKPTEAKSSPLTGAVKVSVFPASGAVGANGLRKIGFYNHTSRDLALVIEGQAVKLPAKTFLHAHLPPTFTWKHTDRHAVKETVPGNASGVDVLFRE